MLKLKVLGCYGSESHGRHSSGYLINDRVLLEAGSVASSLPEKEQLAISHIIISHAHLDHTKELIFLVDNFFNYGRKKIKLAGIPEVMAQLKEHLFNDEIWPDFTRIPAGGEPIIQIEEMSEYQENNIDDLKVIPVPVSHTVSASGFIIRSGTSDIVYTGDTGPTESIWPLARKLSNLKALLIETSFPDGMEDLALESGHLTPSLLRGELIKLNRPDIPVFIAHMKPAFMKQIVKQLSTMDGWKITPLEQGKSYNF